MSTGVNIKPEEKLSNILKKETLYLVGIQIFISVVLFTLPHVIKIVKTGGQYIPFSAHKLTSTIVFDETYQYSYAIRKFLRNGNLFVEDVVEYADTKSPYPILSSLIIAPFVYIFGSFEKAWISLDAIFPTLLWLLLFYAMGFVTKNPWYRSLAAWAVILVPFGPRNFLLMGWESLNAPLEITRKVPPGLSYPHLLAAIVASVLALVSGRKKALIFSGILAGLLFYHYYFYWIGFFTAGAFLAIILLVMRDFISLKKLLTLGLTGVLVGLPIVIMSAYQKEESLHMIHRAGSFSRAFDIEGIFCILVAGLATYYYAFQNFSRKFESDQKNHEQWFILILLAIITSAGIGMNLQVIAGVDLQHHTHFRTRYLQPFLAMALLVFFWKLTERYLANNIGKSLMTFGILVFLGFAFYRQYNAGVTTYELHDASLPRNEMLLYARGNVSSESVIGVTDRQLIVLTASLTGNWSFVPMGLRTKASPGEIYKRYLLLSYLQGYGFHEAWGRIEQTVDRGNRPILWTNLAFILTSELYPSGQEFANEYWKQWDVGEEFSRRKLDFVIFPVNTNLVRLKSHFPGLQINHQNEDWILIELSPKGNQAESA